jgi:hypothetical protein
MFVFVKAQIHVFRVFNEKNMGMRFVLWKDRGMCFVYVLFYGKTGVCVLCTFCFMERQGYVFCVRFVLWKDRGMCFVYVLFFIDSQGCVFWYLKKYGDISFALWEDRVMRFALMYVVFFSIKQISIAWTSCLHIIIVFQQNSSHRFLSFLNI